MAMLTAGELEVMQVLWGHGELKPAEIQKHFGRRVKNATLRSALRVLLEKGHVTRRKVGMAYYYRSKTPDRNAFRRMSRRLAQVFCGGSSAALVARLIETEDFSEDDLREMRKLASSKVPSKSRAKKGRDSQ